MYGGLQNELLVSDIEDTFYEAKKIAGAIQQI